MNLIAVTNNKLFYVKRGIKMSFKKDFIWGSATSSYQVEGAAFEDGKGLSIWDIFCMEEGHIYENHAEL